MEHIKVIYARSTHPVSFLIRLFTWSRWSHVGAVMPDGESVIESVGDKGVIETPLHVFTSWYQEYQVMELPVLSRREAFAFLRKQLGKPYDMTAIYSLALRRDWQETDSWFCSELIARASGLFQTEYTKRITPECLWRISRET